MSKTPTKLKDSPLGKIPENWGVIPLSSLFQIQTGATPLRSKHQAYFAGGTIPWVKTMDLNEGWITQTHECITEVALRECSVQLLPPKTVCVAMYGGWEQIGRTSILRDAATTNQAISSLVKISPFIESEFALRALQYGRHRWKGIAASTRKDPNITRDDVENFLIPLPPLSEQKGIAIILNTIDSTIANTEALIAKLKQMKAGLLHNLLTRGLDENGKLRDAIEHPEQFKDSPLGQIPEDWETCQLSDLIDPARPICYGILMPGYGYPNGVPVIKVKDIINNEIKTDNLLLTSPEIDNQYYRSRLRCGDLLFTIRGTVGRMAFVPEFLEGANITQDTARLAITGAESRYVQQYLQMPLPQAFVELHTLGQAVKGINLRDVRRIPIALPPRTEQIQIIDLCDVYDTRIRLEEAYLGKLKEQKKGLMHDLLTGRVRIHTLQELPG